MSEHEAPTVAERQRVERLVAAVLSGLDAAQAVPSTKRRVGARLEAYLQLTYTAAVVHEGDALAELVARPLYAYRYGSPNARG